MGNKGPQLSGFGGMGTEVGAWALGEERPGHRCAGREANGKLFQSADISCNRFDLRFVKAVRNRAHDCRCVRDFWILAAFFAPIEQFVDDVGIKLTGQTRNYAGACSIGTVASSACRDVLIRQPVLEDFPARRHELASVRRRVAAD